VVADHLACFTPKAGDGIFLPAGTVHAFGSGVVLFEVQQNSDVTFRLYDWDRVDASTSQLRTLQVEQAMACIDFSQQALVPVLPAMEETTPVARERLFECEYFSLWRLRGNVPFSVGAAGVARLVVCIGRTGQVEHRGASYYMEPGGVLLPPAVLGPCLFRPRGEVSVLEVALPHSL
jgi:mannose-6-phosphate isomerase